MNFDPRGSMWSNQVAPGHIFEVNNFLYNILLTIQSRTQTANDSFFLLTFQCIPTTSGSSVEPDFLHLLYKCLPASLLWGLGTSVGEVPPYAASYMAAQARQDFEKRDAELGTTVER